MAGRQRSENLELIGPKTRYSLRDICVRGGVSADYVVELVEYGVLVPIEECAPHDWYFDIENLFRLRRAMRLQRDLDINLPGLATSLDLIDEVARLRREVDRLRRQLSEFLVD